MGIVLVGVGAALAFTVIGFSVFERVRLDRLEGVVEISRRDVFRPSIERFPLSAVTGVEVTSEIGQGLRQRATFAPALLLNQPEGTKVPLTLFLTGRASAERTATIVSDWLNGFDETVCRTTQFAPLISALALIGVNLAAVVPVLSGFWTIWELVTFYWVELLVVSKLFVIKAAILSGTCEIRSPRDYAVGLFLVLGWTSCWLSGTYLLLQSMPFLRGQGLLDFVMGNDDLRLPIAAMIVSHVLAFIGAVVSSGGVDLRRVERYGEQPFTRIMLLAVIILVAPLFIATTGEALYVLGLFVVMKTWLDWRVGKSVVNAVRGGPA